MHKSLILLILPVLLVSCGQRESTTPAVPTPPTENTSQEPNTVDIGTKPVYTVTGSQVTEIR